MRSFVICARQEILFGWWNQRGWDL